jgi:hypothetical protein
MSYPAGPQPQQPQPRSLLLPPGQFILARPAEQLQPEEKRKYRCKVCKKQNNSATGHSWRRGKVRCPLMPISKEDWLKNLLKWYDQRNIQIFSLYFRLFRTHYLVYNLKLWSLQKMSCSDLLFKAYCIMDLLGRKNYIFVYVFSGGGRSKTLQHWLYHLHIYGVQCTIGKFFFNLIQYYIKVKLFRASPSQIEVGKLSVL